MALAYDVKAYVDWSGDGDFADTGEDVSARLLSVATRRGRSSVNDEIAPGSMSFDLDNQEGDYSPYNAGSPLYGNVIPGRACKLEIVANSTTYPVYYGYLSSIMQSRTPSDRPAMQFSAQDAFDKLRLGSVRVALQESQRVDQLITTILDEAGWSATMRALDTATETPAEFWSYRAAPLAALRLAAKQELGGMLYVARNGDITFRNRFWKALRTSAMTISGARSLAVELRREDIYDEVHHTRAGLDVAAAVSTLYSHTPTGYMLQPGSSDPRNTIHGQFAVAGKNVVSPVSTTDYLANSAADGTGTDKTAQVSVSAFTDYGGGFSVTFNNLDSSPVYLYLNSSAAFNIRGQAVRRQGDDRTIEVAGSGAIVSGQVLTDDFEFSDNVAGIEGYAQYRATMLGQWQPRPRIEVIPQTTAELEDLLALELGERVTVTNTSGLYPSQLSGDFHVEAIEWRWAPGEAAVCTLGLFSRDLAGGSFFRISGPAGAGQDYSTIAPAAATVGYDRIAW